MLTSVYKFHGASFNFEFVRDVVTALQNIINVGELELDEVRIDCTSHSVRLTEAGGRGRRRTGTRCGSTWRRWTASRT